MQHPRQRRAIWLLQSLGDPSAEPWDRWSRRVWGKVFRGGGGGMFFCSKWQSRKEGRQIWCNSFLFLGIYEFKSSGSVSLQDTQVRTQSLSVWWNQALGRLSVKGKDLQLSSKVNRGRQGDRLPGNRKDGWVPRTVTQKPLTLSYLTQLPSCLLFKTGITKPVDVPLEHFAVVYDKWVSVLRGFQFL